MSKFKSLFLLLHNMFVYISTYSSSSFFICFFIFIANLIVAPCYIKALNNEKSYTNHKDFYLIENVDDYYVQNVSTLFNITLDSKPNTLRYLEPEYLNKSIISLVYLNDSHEQLIGNEIHFI